MALYSVGNARGWCKQVLRASKRVKAVLFFFFFTGGSRDPSRAGAAGACEEPPHQGAEEDKQRRQFGVSALSHTGKQHRIKSDGYRTVNVLTQI